jgi:hypothetical protein
MEMMVMKDQVIHCLILIEEVDHKVSIINNFKCLDVGSTKQSKSERKGGRMLMMKNRLINNNTTT